jgi:hypothetical protein
VSWYFRVTPLGEKGRHGSRQVVGMDKLQNQKEESEVRKVWCRFCKLEEMTQCEAQEEMRDAER